MVYQEKTGLGLLLPFLKDVSNNMLARNCGGKSTGLQYVENITATNIPFLNAYRSTLVTHHTASTTFR